MGNISPRIYGVKIKMNPPRGNEPAVSGAKQEHKRPHLHLEDDGIIVRFFIDTWTFHEDDESKATRIIKKALEVLEPHQQELINKWNTKDLKKLKVKVPKGASLNF